MLCIYAGFLFNSGPMFVFIYFICKVMGYFFYYFELGFLNMCFFSVFHDSFLKKGKKKVEEYSSSYQYNFSTLFGHTCGKLCVLPESNLYCCRTCQYQGKTKGWVNNFIPKPIRPEDGRPPKCSQKVILLVKFRL